MRFCEKHDGIVHAYGNPSYVAFPVKGRRPTHLNLWYKESAKSDIQQLISELENYK